MGLDGRFLKHDDLLEFCSRFPTRRLELLAAAAPELNGATVRINGQVFGQKFDWSLRTPRVCPACIAENRYFRNWFDLSVIDHCPLHGLQLCHGLGTDRLAWWYPKVGVTPSGLDLARAAPRCAPGDHPWEWYVLGRMGVMAGCAVPLLDDLPMKDVIAVSQIVGLISQVGWRKEGGAKRGQSSAERIAAIIRGFDVIRGGMRSLECELENFAALSGIVQNPNVITFGYNRLWGWLHEAIDQLPESSIVNVIKNLMNMIARSYGVYNRKRPLKQPGSSPAHLNELAKQLGIGSNKLREIAAKLGMIEPHPYKHKCYSFSKDQITELSNSIESLLRVDQAAIYLGISLITMYRKLARGEIRPFVRFERGYRFRARDLDAISATIKHRLPSKERSALQGSS
jgi:excisionase family DNA binding protein